MTETSWVRIQLGAELFSPPYPVKSGLLIQVPRGFFKQECAYLVPTQLEANQAQYV